MSAEIFDVEARMFAEIERDGGSDDRIGIAEAGLRILDQIDNIELLMVSTVADIDELEIYQ